LELAKIGRNDEDRGIYRTAFSDTDMEGKRWLLEKIESAGLESHSDGAANISGILPGTNPDAPRVLIGSHIDTVPCAGMLDGALGVLVALECLQSLQEMGVKPDCSLELIAFSDEEGRFGGMFGSQSVCGKITPETLHSKSDLDGMELGEAMLRQGLDPMRALEAGRDSESIRAYLELHIEQGPELETANAQVGLVDEIAGLFKWMVRLRGEPNHAGTTPMRLRKDALMGLADFAHEIPRILEENGGERSRATIGKAQILPGSPNTVPGLVEFSLDVRDTQPETLEDLSGACRKALSAISRRRGLMFEFDVQSEIEPAPCDPGLVAIMERQAQALGLNYLKMPSGAAHDAQTMSSIAPVAMIFVPSQNGVSHSPAEWTAWSDIEAGANLMQHTLMDLISSK
jgi:N-carbamoyl-L-amino-acid hydrolase